MAKIIWTSEANRWLKDIFDFIADDNPDAAMKVVEGIFAKAQLIKEYPEIGYKYDHESGSDIRILLYGHYRIAYYIASPDDLYILSVFHGSLKIENYLNIQT